MYCSSNPILEDLYSEANHATTLLNAAIVTIHNMVMGKGFSFVLFAFYISTLTTKCKIDS